LRERFGRIVGTSPIGYRRSFRLAKMPVTDLKRPVWRARKAGCAEPRGG
jgi:hypothetical protein